MVDDVDRALREELEIFPVCHHSPSSALAMALRLRSKRPRIIYLSCARTSSRCWASCATAAPPVALQAFASELRGFPRDWGPARTAQARTGATWRQRLWARGYETWATT
jgi:hypothetical protein